MQTVIDKPKHPLAWIAQGNCEQLKLGRESLDFVADVLAECGSQKGNPTLSQVIGLISERIERAEPIQLLMCQSFDESEPVLEGSLMHQLERRDRRFNVTRFISGVNTTSWGRVRGIRDNTPYPVQIQIILNDIDFLTILAGYEWCSERSLRRLTAEVTLWKELVRERAACFFGPDGVTVRCWSDMYGVEEYGNALLRARDPRVWSRGETAALLEASLEIDLRHQPALAAGTIGDFALTTAQIQKVVWEGLVRQAAGFRVKADAAAKQKAIQVWLSGSSSNPFFPVVLSNFDGAGYTASLAI